MAIAFDNATSTEQSGNFSFTTSGSNIFLVVAVWTDNANDCTGVSYNSVALTKSVQVQNPAGGGFAWVALWTLAGATSGSHTVAFSGTLDAASASSYNGADTIDNTATQTSGPSASVSGSITTLTDNAWIVAAARENQGRVKTAVNMTNRMDSGSTGGGEALADSNAAKTPAGSYSQGWTVSAATPSWGMVMLSVKPFVTPSGPANVKTWDGVTQSTGIKTYLGVTTASVKTVDGIN